MGEDAPLAWARLLRPPRNEVPRNRICLLAQMLDKLAVDSANVMAASGSSVDSALAMRVHEQANRLTRVSTLRAGFLKSNIGEG